MSFINKIKTMLTGGSDAQSDSHAGHDRASEHDDLAVGEVPPAPVDPLGTPLPPADSDDRP
jgi:hypothetical protein